MRFFHDWQARDYFTYGISRALTGETGYGPGFGVLSGLLRGLPVACVIILSSRLKDDCETTSTNIDGSRYLK